MKVILNKKTARVTKKSKNLRNSSQDDKKILASFAYQSLKFLSKVIKLVKGFIIQKIIRKAREDDEGCNPAIMLERVKQLKEIEHTDVARRVYSKYIEPTNAGLVDSSPEVESIREFEEHKRIKEAIRELQEKLENIQTLCKEKQEQRKEYALAKLAARSENISGRKMKNIMTDRNLGIDQRTKAVFVDSLADTADMELAEYTIKKQQQKMDKKSMMRGKKSSKKELPDLSSYMPQSMREDTQQTPLDTQDNAGLSAVTDSRINLKRVRNDLQHSSEDEVSDRSIFNARQRADPQRINGDRIPAGRNDRMKDNRIVRPRNNDSNSRSSKVTKQPAVPQVVSKEDVANGKDWKSTGLHPSWAAKLVATKSTGIGEFSGKKIVFEDD